MPKVRKEWGPPRAWRLWLMGCFLVIASVFDAWMTLEFLALGGEEANPIVVPYIRLGTTTFIVWKAVIGLCAAVALGLGCRLRRWIWWAFNVTVWTYIGLSAYHIIGLLLVR